MKNALLLIFLAAFACNQPSKAPAVEAPMEVNPAAEGFNPDSDEKAIAIADEVMEAMGGRKSWDDTRYLSWNFFGVRTLLWDKQTGDVRIDFLNRDHQIMVNEKTMEGSVWKEGEKMENQDSVAFYLERGKNIWINDSYWLVMPFKLKDSGVLLTYVGKDSTEAGEAAEVIRLTFEGVGKTPENAYNVWVSEKDDLVKQWAWYINASDTVARFTRPWDNYQQMGGIMLSEERGDRDLSDVKVLESVPNGIFEDPTITL